MGNDGGYIAKRSEMVKEKTKEIRVDYLAINQAHSKFCAITNRRLQLPIVGCRMGYLYSKEAMLECLIKKTIPKAFRHIKKSRDIKDINVLEKIGEEYSFMCPLTREVHNGINKFIFIWKCGCMMSAEAYDACKSDMKCPVCQKEHKEIDVVSLWDSPETIELKKKIMFQLKAKKKLKKQKKLTNKGEAEKEGALLGKREPEKGDLPEFSGPVKKTQDQKNILDDLVQEGYNTKLYKSLFHKEHEVEDAKGLIFRNVRFGIR